MDAYILVSILGGAIGSYAGVQLYYCMYNRKRTNPFQMSKMKEFEELFEKERNGSYKEV